MRFVVRPIEMASLSNEQNRSYIWMKLKVDNEAISSANLNESNDKRPYSAEKLGS